MMGLVGINLSYPVLSSPVQSRPVLSGLQPFFRSAPQSGLQLLD